MDSLFDCSNSIADLSSQNLLRQHLPACTRPEFLLSNPTAPVISMYIAPSILASKNACSTSRWRSSPSLVAAAVAKRIQIHAVARVGEYSSV